MVEHLAKAKSTSACVSWRCAHTCAETDGAIAAGIAAAADGAIGAAASSRSYWWWADLELVSAGEPGPRFA